MAFGPNRILKWLSDKRPAVAIVGTALIATSVWAQSPPPQSVPAQAPSSEPPVTPSAVPGEQVSVVSTHLTNDVQAPTLAPALNAVIPRAPAKPKILPPVGPPVPARSPAAIMQVLDKVTAETLRFAAPVGQRVRYKSIIFTVKTCETRDPGSVQPKPVAYLIIDSVAGAGRSSGVSNARRFARRATTRTT